MKRFFISLAGSSVLWGLVATFLFYFAVNAGILRNDTIARYSTGHPVEYVTIAMFFVGVCDLLFKIAQVRRERKALKRGALFPPKRREKEPVENVETYLDTIAKARDVRGNSTYLTRLADALQFMKSGGSPDDLDQELRRLADDAYDARDAEYGMARAFVWAIPILGFLGTVLGITVALGSLDLQHLETTGENLAAGLQVAFDTTALALSLVFAIYFLQFFARKQDSALAASVDRLVDSELRGRFQAETDLGTASSEIETTRRFLQTVSGAFADAIKTQTELWGETTVNAAKESAAVLRDAAERVGESLDRRMTGGAAEWSQTLANAQRDFVETALRPMLQETADRVARIDSLEAKIAVQTESLRAALCASADLVAIEDRLTRTLEKIAEVGEFEKTLNNLSATVCLLNSKLTGGASSSNVFPETVRFDADSVKRAARRSDALAALDSLESSLENDVGQTLSFQTFSVVGDPADEETSTRVEAAENADVKEPANAREIVAPPMPKLTDDPAEPIPTEQAASTARKRSALGKKRSA